jgi:hypothetical protein
MIQKRYRALFEAVRALGLPIPVSCGVAFAVLLDLAIQDKAMSEIDTWLFGLAVLSLVSSGWLHTLVIRRKQLVDCAMARRVAGRRTFRLVKRMDPVFWVVSQLSTILMICFLPMKIGEVYGSFVQALLAALLIVSACASGRLWPPTLARLIRRKWQAERRSRARGSLGSHQT